MATGNGEDFFAFKGNPYPTVGIEQEFHLIDPGSAELAPRVDDVVDALPAGLRKRTAHELFFSVLETQSPPFASCRELRDNLREDRRLLAQACRGAGVLLAAAASHPFGDWRKEKFIDEPHYEWVGQECGYIARRLLSYGLHVHVGMRSADAAIYVINEFRRWLFPIMALSANSPYFEGQDTGLATVRSHLMSSMPRAGMPSYFKDLNAIGTYYRKFLETGDIESPGSLWWHLRPQPPLGTAELRMLDLPTDTARCAVIAAIVQNLMAYLQDAFEAGEPVSDLDRIYLEQNQWRAMRHGLDTKIVDPKTGEVLELREQLERLFEEMSAKAGELGNGEFLDQAREYLHQPTEARQQRDYVAAGHSLRELELWIADRTAAV